MKIKAKITKRSVDALNSPDGRETRLWDTELNGFCVRAYPSGRKVYSITYRIRGRFRWCTIGKHGDPWTAEAARKKAQELIGEIAKGNDPGSQRAVANLRAITVTKLIDIYLEEGPRDRPDKRASSWANDKCYLNNHVRALLGKRVVDELRPTDIAQFQSDVLNGKSARKKPAGRGKPVKGGSGAAAHAVRSFSAALGWAVDRELIKSNPCDRMRKLQDGARERYLSEDEARRLFSAIEDLLEEKAIAQDQVDCIELISYTAARRGEIQGLRWREVDFERKFLILPPLRHKTGGTNQPKVIPLSGRCIEILRRRRSSAPNNSEFVFPSNQSCPGHTTNIRHTWGKIQKRAGLEDFRVHDFRHAYASFAINSGQSLKMIGANLGHKKSSTTERYAHLLVEARRPVAENVERIYDALRTKSSA